MTRETQITISMDATPLNMLSNILRIARTQATVQAITSVDNALARVEALDKEPRISRSEWTKTYDWMIGAFNRLMVDEWDNPIINFEHHSVDDFAKAWQNSKWVEDKE